MQDYDQWVLTFIRDVAVAREKIPDRYRLWTIMQITSMNRTAEPKSLFKKKYAWRTATQVALALILAICIFGDTSGET